MSVEFVYWHWVYWGYMGIHAICLWDQGWGDRIHVYYIKQTSVSLYKTNKCVINSMQQDSGLKHINALARDRLLVPLDKKVA